jgi:hypothetical protein
VSLPPDCERLRDVAAELALGIADGEERAWALEHVAGCSACRAEVERLAAVADELTLIAPPAEPPAGFEGRVVERLGPAPVRPARTRRLAPSIRAGIAAAVGAAAAAAIVWFATGDDRDLADSYRDTLAIANGEYFDAAALDAPGGATIGYVYGYQGRSSWILTVVFDGLEDGRYRTTIVTQDGERARVRALAVSAGRGSAGGALPVAYDEVAEVRLLDDRGREVADAELDH